MTFFARSSIIRLEKESELSIRSRKGYVVKNRLEELRKQRGIKQEDLATALEVSRQTIGSLENGRYNPSIILAFKIARYFQMSIEEIFTCTDCEKDTKRHASCPVLNCIYIHGKIYWSPEKSPVTNYSCLDKSAVHCTKP